MEIIDYCSSADIQLQMKFTIYISLLRLPNGTPQAGWFNNRYLFLEVCDHSANDLVSSEGSLPRLQMATFSWRVHISLVHRQGETELVQVLWCTFL